MLETKLESVMLENNKFQERLSRLQSEEMEVKTQLERQKAENARLMANLNEAKAQIHFTSKKEIANRDEA